MIGPHPASWRDFQPDPTGETYGVPTYLWRCAPDHLQTRRQLTAKGLRPNGQDIQAQVVLMRVHRKPLAAYLYDVNQATPKRTASPAQLAALAKANHERQLRVWERHGFDRAEADRVGDPGPQWEQGWDR
ncbi:RRQRL motif-containing zinc-binding protein [Nocardia brasiliensis]|uniref:RRQRL motif-containing zinc-binding protein n=1 Tax=Nocardia brasiliensis TaxID=37326 RepID=UPI0024581BC7|nr:RRQRL motif-containing zinc-binding protein [Nocardia brasiliensis]